MGVLPVPLLSALDSTLAKRLTYASEDANTLRHRMWAPAGYNPILRSITTERPVVPLQGA